MSSTIVNYSSDDSEEHVESSNCVPSVTARIDPLYIYAVDDLLNKEVSKHDVRTLPHLNPQDMEFFNAVAHRQTDESLIDQMRLFEGLIWRFRIQKTYLEIFMVLHDEGMVSLDGLKAPMDLTTYRDEEVLAVANALKAFPYVRNAIDRPPKYTQMTTAYETPQRWLAVLIVRGARDHFEHIVNKISDVGLLTGLAYGGLYSETGFQDAQIDNAVVRQAWPSGRVLMRDPAANMVREGLRTEFCFWLPCEMGEGVTIEEVYDRFFDEYEEIDTLYRLYRKVKVEKEVAIMRTVGD